MKNLLFVFACALLLGGCTKDTVERQYTFYRPVYTTKAEVLAQVKANSPETITNPGKIFYRNGFLFLNEMGQGVHILDVRNPKDPINRAFVKIPGNIDLAVRGNILYADLGIDLVAIDISNPDNVLLKKVLPGVFPQLMYFDQRMSDSYITSAVRVDTTIIGEASQSWGFAEDRALFFANNVSAAAVTNGVGGSMARFALADDRLYTVDYSDLKIFKTTVPESPEYVGEQHIGGWNIETIYPFKDRLFIGSMQGMYIYDITNKDAPKQTGKFEHARVCDPVITDGINAYVTLRGGSLCGGFTNQLDVVDVRNIYAPSLIKSYPMDNPHGLSKDGDLLIICDGAKGLRFLDAKDPENITQISELGGMESFDVIAMDGTAFVSAKDGLYIVDYSTPERPAVQSKFTFQP